MIARKSLLPQSGSFVTVKKFSRQKNVQKEVLRRYMCILVDFENFFCGCMYVCVRVYILYISETNRPIYAGQSLFSSSREKTRYPI